MISFYYDHSGELTTDDEGNLVQLCSTCAAQARRDGIEIEHASRGAEVCEVCDAYADPEGQRDLVEGGRL